MSITLVPCPPAAVSRRCTTRNFWCDELEEEEEEDVCKKRKGPLPSSLQRRLDDTTVEEFDVVEVLFSELGDSVEFETS